MHKHPMSAKAKAGKMIMNKALARPTLYRVMSYNMHIFEKPLMDVDVWPMPYIAFVNNDLQIDGDVTVRPLDDIGFATFCSAKMLAICDEENLSNDTKWTLFSWCYKTAPFEDKSIWYRQILSQCQNDQMLRDPKTSCIEAYLSHRVNMLDMDLENVIVTEHHTANIIRAKKHICQDESYKKVVYNMQQPVRKSAIKFG